MTFKDLVSAKYYSRYPSRKHRPVPFDDIHLAIIEAIEEVVFIKKFPCGYALEYLPQPTVRTRGKRRREE